MDTKRFHNPAYKRQIHAVRSHKRRIYKAPENNFQKLLHFAGLNSLLKQLIAAAIFLFLAYLIYFAGFLKITTANVHGATAEESAQIENTLKDYIRTFDYIFPQKNILFFSSSRFKNYLLSRDYSISAVNQIRKKSLHTIDISIEQRVPAYTFQNLGNFYILNSDGNLSNQLQIPNPNFMLISDTAMEGLNSGDNIFSRQKYDFLNYINANFQSQIQLPIDHFEIPGKVSSDLLVFSKGGFKVYFDSSTDPKLFLQRFFTVWNGLNPDQKKKLAYADLRFDPKVYVCYNTDPCAK